MRRWILVAALGLALAAGRPLGAQGPTALPTAPVRPPEGAAWLHAALMHERWTERDSMPTAPIGAILEASDGFLWLGTERGAARFDGVAFAPLPAALDTVIGERLVRSIVQTGDGALWFTVQERGIVRWREGRAAVLDTTHGLPDIDVRALYVDRAGTLWVASGTGVAVLDGDRFRRVRAPRTLARSVAAAPDGTIWVASPRLTRVRGDSLEPVRVVGLHRGEEALSLLWARDGALWLGTVGGLVRLEPIERGAGAAAGSGAWRVVARYDASRGLSTPYVGSIAEDAEGRIWAATTGGGIFVVAGSRVARYDARDGLSDDVANVVRPGAAGRVWVGTRAGLDRFRPRLLHTITELHGLTPHFLWSIAADGDGMWLGTSGGGLYWATTDGRLRRAVQPLPSAIVYGVMPTADGTLWVRTSAGLARYRDGRPVAIPALSAEERAQARAAFVDRDGVLWLGGGFGVVRVAGTSVLRLRPGRDAPNRSTEAFAQTADGTVWMKGSDLVGYRDGRLRRYGVTPATRAVTSLAADGEDLWIGTYAGGVMLVRDGRVHEFPQLRTRRRVFAVLPDDADGLWLATDAGLQRVSRSALRAHAAGRREPIAVRSFDRSHGLWNLEFNVAGQNPAARSRDGRLWFSSVQGAVVVDPARLPPLPPRPSPVIESVLLDGRPLAGGAGTPDSAAVPRGRGALEIRYLAPTLGAPARVTFRHRLVGYDTGWTYVGTRRAAFYTGVPGGRYRFEVQASLGDDRWSPAVAVPIALRPRLVENGVVRLLAALAGVAALIAAVTVVNRRRTRRLRARAAELAGLVEERTRALQQLNEQLEQRVADRTAELRAEHAERLRLQEDLQQARRLDSVGRLAGGVAHDLNNMLTAVLTFADLAEAASEDDEQRADIQEIRAAGRRATNLTQQLLAFARRQVINPQVLDLRAVVAELATLLRRLLGPAIEVEIRVPDQLWAVRVDPSQVEQVLVNLVVNARDAMPEGGRLHVELANAELDAHAAAHRSLAPGDYVRLTVADTGTGMSPDVRSRVFEPFFTTKEQGKGTGLGLATCHGIVAQAGGAIDLWSETGRGTRFEVWLPRSTEAGAAPAPEEAPLLPPGNETILLVDDEEPVRTAARRVLAGCGYTVIEAMDGEDALRVASGLDRAPALLLCDVVMPRLGGVALVRRLRERWPDVRVLLMSGYVERALPADTATSGTFLRKPFSSSALARRVREVLDAADGIAEPRHADASGGAH